MALRREQKELRDQMDDNFRDLIQWLLFGLVDFDFYIGIPAARSMPDRTEECLNGTGVIRETPDGAALAVGNMSYHTVLVPDLRTIRSTTLSRLEALADAGGNVVSGAYYPGDILQEVFNEFYHKPRPVKPVST